MDLKLSVPTQSIRRLHADEALVDEACTESGFGVGTTFDWRRKPPAGDFPCPCPWAAVPGHPAPTYECAPRAS